MIPGSLQQIAVIVFIPLHVEAVEAQILALRGGLVICAHPGDQILHLLCPVDGEADGCHGVPGGAPAAVDVAVDGFAAAEIALQGQGADAVALHQDLEYLQLQRLELAVSVGRLAEGDDFGLLRHAQVGDRFRVFFERLPVGAFSGAEAAEMGEYGACRREQQNGCQRNGASGFMLFLFHMNPSFKWSGAPPRIERPGNTGMPRFRAAG